MEETRIVCRQAIIEQREKDVTLFTLFYVFQDDESSQRFQLRQLV